MGYKADPKTKFNYERLQMKTTAEVLDYAKYLAKKIKENNKVANRLGKMIDEYFNANKKLVMREKMASINGVMCPYIGKDVSCEYPPEIIEAVADYHLICNDTDRMMDILVGDVDAEKRKHDRSVDALLLTRNYDICEKNKRKKDVSVKRNKLHKLFGEFKETLS